MAEGVYGDTRFADVPVTVTVVVGTARTPVRTLLELTQDSVVPLDSKIDDPVVIYAGDRVIAHGELVEDDARGEGALAIRITELMGDADV